MAENKLSRFCKDCRRNTLHTRYQISDSAGCLLTLSVRAEELSQK